MIAPAVRTSVRLTAVLCIFVVFSGIFVTSKRCDYRRRIRLLSRCRECSLNNFLRCPPPYIHTSPGIGIRGCPFRLRFGAVIGVVTVPGCRHSCERFVTYRQCCSGFWGGRCEACPGTPVCSGAGKCFDRIDGNGTCTCQDGFKGTACELCQNSTMFGPGCNQSCTCERGICDSSVNSTGQCMPYSCHIGYFGANCNIRHPACDHQVSCAKHAECFKLNDTNTCICEPGYTGDGKTSCTAIDPCKGNAHGCHSKAKCSYLGPGKHHCDCLPGYRGDGRVCIVVDPCLTNDGGCPKNSSVCHFLSPGRSNCSCLPGFVNFTSGRGCSMVDLCADGNHGGCDTNANCLMVKAGEKRCVCKKGYRGNGTSCYGNIIKRTSQLNSDGPPKVKGHLTYVSQILSHSLARPLSDTGPFTAFLPTDVAIEDLPLQETQRLLSDLDFSSHVIRLHLVASDLDSVALNDSRGIVTLQGTSAAISQENGSLFYRVNGSVTKAQIIASDFIAGNGIIHVIDKVFLYPGNFNKTTTFTPLQVIERDPKFSTFASFIAAAGLRSFISRLSGQVTIFIPVNSALNFDQLTMDYLTKTDKGKEKLQSIIKNHLAAGKFEVTDLMSLPRIKSLQGESNTVQRKSNGSIVIGEKAQIVDSNIVVKHGVIHRVNNLLVPSMVLPLVPNYSYNTTFIRASGVCYRCDTMPSFPNKGCPSSYTPSGGFIQCRFRLTTFTASFVLPGCKIKNCLKAVKVPECSRGYYGRNCRPCPGPLEQACSLRGSCDDRIRGNGSCTCQPSFGGVACEKCATPNTFGPQCNANCTCAHGVCDNGIQGNGTCRANSCKAGYHGDNCDLRDTPCSGSSPLRCHWNAHCVKVDNQDTCRCNAGYEGPGTNCYEINPCKKPNRGGCHKDATCTKTGPGTNNCKCDPGFHGDGSLCVAANPCLESSRCHSNARCHFVGPGQSSCMCKPGYTGNGKSCVEINKCLVMNGGCSPKAKCYRTGPAQHNCTCFFGYFGNGFSCWSSVAALLQEDGRFSGFYRFVKDAHLEYFLSREDLQFSVFVPANDALANMNKNEKDYWRATSERMKYFVKYFVVNGTLSEKDLISRNGPLAVLNGETFNITYHNKQILVNGKAEIIKTNITAGNGIIHILNKVLIPRRLSESKLPSVLDVLSKTKVLSRFFSMLQLVDFMTQVKKCSGCTIFAPVNDALNSRNMTLTEMKYHVVPKYISRDHFFNGQQFSTLLGQDYTVQLTKRQKSSGYMINGISYGNGIRANNTIIYMLPRVLVVPPRRRCDSAVRYRSLTQCFFCALMYNCPSGWSRLGMRRCSFWWGLGGCQAYCIKVQINKKCCSGFWGADCQACPGNGTNACSGNGHCSDGTSGSGHCQCFANFTGTACEKCLPGKYGNDCSSKCACAHGRCNEGIHGDGTCECHHGWQGPVCDRRADPAKCSPQVCHRFASCRVGNSSYGCECDSGYTGNGTHCREIHACDKNNGGCHKRAICNPHPEDPSSLATCRCIKGYTGDGQFCSDIDLCQVNNGGCHANATCASTGPGLRSCHCNDGYLGDGLVCKPEDPCKENHGGCSLRATCTKTGPGQRQCKCRARYYGNGETCVGGSMEVLEKDPELSKVNDLYKTYKLDKLLVSGAKTNILAPTNQALARILRQGNRRRRDVSSSPSIEQYLRYHIIGCVRFNNYTSQSGQYTSLLGAPIWVVRNGSDVVFMDAQNNTARISQGFQSANGFVFKLDAVLTPPKEYINLGDASKSYIKVFNDLGFTVGASVIKRAGVENIFFNPFGRPYLVFISTNQAIDRLPSDLKTRLSNQSNADELASYVKYHIVHNAPVNSSTEFFIRSGGGVELRTMQGESLFVSCKGDKGDLYVNGVSRISKRDILFDGGVGFAIDDSLIPLGLGGKCDHIIHEKTYGRCGSCLSPEGCPDDSTLVGTTNHSCSFDGGISGCQHICMRRKIVRKCCKDHYGVDCRGCPGGVGMACSHRGQCDDGLTGTGRCNCHSGYNGTACEKCSNGLSCPAPRSCHQNNGGCHVFATCSDASGVLNCTCLSRYEGDGFYCQMKDPCEVNNGACGQNATCHFTGPNNHRCQCKQGFYEVNGRCQLYASSSPCAVNHGGCSDHADCTVFNAAAVCKCWPSYVGDGVSCHGNIIQTLQDTIKVRAFYKALYHLTPANQRNKLLSDLQIDSKLFTVFAVADSALRLKGFNITLAKNHVVSGRIKLSTIHNVSTVETILGTKVMIRKWKNGGVTINGVAHVLADIQATNGVIYIIDQTLPIVGRIPSTPTPSPNPPPTASTSEASTQRTQPSSNPITPSSSPPSSSPPTNLPTSKSSQLSSRTSSSKPVTQPSSPKQPPTSKPPYNSTSTQKPAVNARQRKEKGLSGGAVAGILILVLVIVVLVGGAIWYCRRRELLPNALIIYKREDDTMEYNSDDLLDVGPSVSYNNPMYDTSEPGPTQINVLDEKGLPLPFTEHCEFTNPMYLELNEHPIREETTEDVLCLEDDEKPGEEKC